VASHAKVRVEVNSEISEWLRRVDEVGPDSKCWRGKLMTTTSCRTPEQVGLARVQLQTVGQHLCGNVVDTCRQAHLEVCDSRWSARAVYPVLGMS